MARAGEKIFHCLFTVSRLACRLDRLLCMHAMAYRISHGTCDGPGRPAPERYYSPGLFFAKYVYWVVSFSTVTIALGRPHIGHILGHHLLQRRPSPGPGKLRALTKPLPPPRWCCVGGVMRDAVCFGDCCGFVLVCVLLLDGDGGLGCSGKWGAGRIFRGMIGQSEGGGWILVVMSCF